MEPHRKGDFTEAVVIAELKRREIPVSVPFGDNERYDIVAESPTGNLYRLQIKTGRLNDGVVDFHAVSSHTNSQGNVYKPYEGDIDYFAVYCHELETLYLVPEESVRTAKSLRVEDPKRPDRKINRACEYRFDRLWPPDSCSDSTLYEPPVPAKRDSVPRVIAAMERLNVTTYRKVHGTGLCDLVAALPHGLIRITVRTGNEIDGRIQLSRTPDETARRDTEETDYYALYCPSREETYLVGTDEFGTSLSLRTDDPDQIQHDTRFAADYRLAAVWPPDGTPTVSSRSAVGAAIERFETLDVTVGVVHDDAVAHDLLVETDDGVTRVAVVPVWASGGCLRLKPDSCAGVDTFVLYYREGDTCYAVGAEEFERSISIRVEEPAKADPSINWAADYELTDRWPV